jgi:hypothetical protein
LTAAIFAVGCTNAFDAQFLNLESLVNKTPNDVTPQPGALQVLLDVTSASSILHYVTALGPYYAFVGKSYDINFDKTIAGVDFSIS